MQAFFLSTAFPCFLFKKIIHKIKVNFLVERHGLNPLGEEQEGNIFIGFSGTRPLQKDLEKNLGTRGDKKQEKTGGVLRDLQKNKGQATF